MRTFFAVLVSLLVSGCAFTVDQIDVPYQPAAAASPVAGATMVRVAVAATDGRTSHEDRVGSKKNGFGAETAPIVATNDVVETVRRAIEGDLAARGFQIGGGGPTVAVEVRRFYNDFQLGFWSADAVGDVSLSVKVLAADGALALAKNYDGQATETGVMLMGGDNARRALVPALADAVQKVVNDPELLGVLTARRLPDGSAPTS